MSSILTAHIPKVYKSIDELDTIFNFVKTFSVHGAKLEIGNIHSVYAKLSPDDYHKLYAHFVAKSGDATKRFFYYDNNLIGVLIYDNICEKWQYEESTVYAFNEMDVCYIVDEFVNRSTFNPEEINNLKLRYIASGFWFMLDDKSQVFVGNRLIYKNYNTSPNLQMVAYKKRLRNNFPNSMIESATSNTMVDHLAVCNDPFILYRTVNSTNYMYNKVSVRHLLCNQKLNHLVEQPLKLLNPIVIV